MSYKWCAVPKCRNTSIKTPDKLFICVPKNVKMRRKWLELARRNWEEIKPNSNIFFCEDHFNLEQDMANYYQFKMGFSHRIMLVDKALPSKFSCQPDRNKRNCDSGPSRSAFVKRQKMELIQECENTLHQSINPKVESKISHEQAIKEGPCDIELRMSHPQTTAIDEKTSITNYQTTAIKEEPCEIEITILPDQFTVIKEEPSITYDQSIAIKEEQFEIEPLTICDKSTSTDSLIVTAEKSVHCCLFNEVQMRSMAVQTTN